jgi:CheY-like chemotaxis protein
MDGYEATRCIREVEAQTNKPRNKILAFTANVMPEDRQKCIDAGMVRATRVTLYLCPSPYSLLLSMNLPSTTIWPPPPLVG